MRKAIGLMDGMAFMVIGVSNVIPRQKSEPVPRTSTSQGEKKENKTHSPKLQNECLLYFAFTIAFYKLPSARLNTMSSRITSSHAKQSKC